MKYFNIIFSVLYIFALFGCSDESIGIKTKTVAIKPVTVMQPTGDVKVGDSNYCVYDMNVNPENRCALVAPRYQCKSKLVERLKSANESEKVQVYIDAASFLLRNDFVDEAIVNLKHAYDLVENIDERKAQELLRDIAIAQLRQGETDNCRENHNAETCIVPLSQVAIHSNQRGSRAAITSIEQLLKITPGDKQMKWLLNLAYMTIGEYPNGINKDYLIPDSYFRSNQSFPRFKNIAPDLGLNKNGLAGGVIVDDFTGDGYVDILFSSNGVCDAPTFYVNNGKNGFDDKTKNSGFEQQYSSTHMIQSDYDNDGLLDVYLTRGIWETPRETYKHELTIPLYNSLLRNLGNGKFEDVTEKVNLKQGRNYNIASVWADFNNDGFLDLFVCNNNQPPQLFINQKGKTFEIVSDHGLTNDGACMGVAVGDVDRNGTDDIFLSVYSGESLLFLNNGDAEFHISSTFNQLVPVGSAFASWFSDYDEDNDIDLFVAAWGGDNSTQNIGKLMAGEMFKGDHLTVLQNNGKGEFQSVDLGLKNAIMVMGVNSGDFDNDGYEDMLLGTGGPDLDILLPNRAFLNKQGKTFVDVTFSGGFGNVQKGHGIGFADLDNDGDQDIVASFGGWFDTDRFMPSLYENPGFSNNWITIRLTGTKSNRSAIGSHIRIDIVESGQKRTIHRVVNSGGSFGSNSLQAEVGIGHAKDIEQITIQWAGSNTTSVLKNVKANQIIRIIENSDGFVPVEGKALQFIKSKEHHHQHDMHI